MCASSWWECISARIDANFSKCSCESSICKILRERGFESNAWKPAFCPRFTWNQGAEREGRVNEADSKTFSSLQDFRRAGLRENQTATAARAGVNQSLVSAVERGLIPNDEQGVELARGYCVSETEFWRMFKRQPFVGAQSGNSTAGTSGSAGGMSHTGAVPQPGVGAVAS